MGKEKPRFKLDQSKKLVAAMNVVLSYKLAQYKYYKNRTFKTLHNLGIILNAAGLLLLYLWNKPFEEKRGYSTILAITGISLFLIKYIQQWWWPHFYAKFEKEGPEKKILIVCAHSPLFSGKYAISIHCPISGSYFKRLPPPVVSREFNFEDYFTKGGHIAEAAWKQTLDTLINEAIYQRNEKKKK